VKILQICHKPPFPDVDGGTKAEKLLTKLLIEAGNFVDIFTIATEKHPFKARFN
jgi:polysaccharide biosynthesis protein PslH